MKLSQFLGVNPEPKVESKAEPKIPSYDQSNKSKPWTKPEVETILKLWEDHSLKEVANAVHRGMGSVGYIVNHLRKSGFKLSSKRFPSSNSAVILEALEELRKEKII